MAITITEILATTGFVPARQAINANFNSLKDEVENIESVFGLSLTSGNIDVSTATGGSIKGKTGAFNSMVFPAAGTATITLNGSTGAGAFALLTAGTSVTTPTLNVSSGIANTGTMSTSGTATFSGLTSLQGGLIYGKVDLGATNAHTVLNSDRVLYFDGSASPGSLTLTPDVGLLDGHVVTLVKYGSGACLLDPSNIQGFGTGSINFSTDAYKSSVTLRWDSALAKWVIIGSSNMTIV